MPFSRDPDQRVFKEAVRLFEEWFKASPDIVSFAPGRIEVIGNHTDYNEGFVLSAAIDRGTYFLASRANGTRCRVVAGDVREEVSFRPDQKQPEPDHRWARYVLGVAAGISAVETLGGFPAFHGLFLGDVPIGAGLSSSAALEMSTALACCRSADLDLPLLDMARIGRSAEHRYAGVRTGLLDQITSLYGRKDQLVLTDFRTLQVDTVPLEGICFLVCDTGIRHSLVDSAYNDRRSACERAAAHFAGRLDHSVRSLRDVSRREWEMFGGQMGRVDRLRSIHVIGENERVLEGRRLLEQNRIEAFGRLMFESHESSRVKFENSTDELDFLVREAESLPSVLGARLTGGGFGGSVIVLTTTEAAAAVSASLMKGYEAAYGRTCEVLSVMPEEGAHFVDPSGRGEERP